MKSDIQALVAYKNKIEQLELELRIQERDKNDTALKSILKIISLKQEVNKHQKIIHELEQKIAVSIEWKQIGNRFIKIYKLQEKIEIEYSKKNLLGLPFDPLHKESLSATENLLKEYEEYSSLEKMLNDKKRQIEYGSLSNEQIKGNYEKIQEELIHNSQIMTDIKGRLYNLLEWHLVDVYKLKLLNGDRHQLEIKKVE